MAGIDASIKLYAAGWRARGRAGRVGTQVCVQLLAGHASEACGAQPTPEAVESVRSKSQAWMRQPYCNGCAAHSLSLAPLGEAAFVPYTCRDGRQGFQFVGVVTPWRCQLVDSKYTCKAGRRHTARPFRVDEWKLVQACAYRRAAHTPSRMQASMGKRFGRARAQSVEAGACARRQECVGARQAHP